MPVLKLKTMSGMIADLRCEQIIEIDGKPYQPTGEAPDLIERVGFLEGQVAALLDLFTQPAEEVHLPQVGAPYPVSFHGVN